VICDCGETDDTGAAPLADSIEALGFQKHAVCCDQELCSSGWNAQGAKCIARNVLGYEQVGPTLSRTICSDSGELHQNVA
jgi:hypothetical protein